MKEIETERLILRHINENDVADLFEYCQEPNVGPAAGWEPHDCIETTRAITKEIFIGQENIFGIILKADESIENRNDEKKRGQNNEGKGKVIGTIGLLPDPQRKNPDALMLGYAMGEKYWGKGIMTEAAKAVLENAFKELPVSIISCTCYTSNPRSQRVIEKCGFVYEGCLRQGEKRYDGEMMDVRCYSIIRPEHP